MIGVDRAVVDELPDADPLHHGVVVALDQLGFVDQVTGFGVIPTRLGVVFPLDQAGGPGQLEHAGGRQLVVDLHLEAGPRRAVRAELGTADDDHQVGGVDVEVGPRRRRRSGEAARRRRQRGDGAIPVRRPIRRPPDPTSSSSRALAASSAMSRSMSPSPPVRSALQRLLRGGHLRLDVAQVEQHGGHLLGRVGGDAGLFDRADDRVVVHPSARCRGSSRSARAPG